MWLESQLLDAEVDGSNSGISMSCQYVVFSLLSCEMNTRWGQHCEGCSALRVFRRNST